MPCEYDTFSDEAYPTSMSGTIGERRQL